MSSETTQDYRTGQGFDVHPLVPGNHLVLGGVMIDAPHGFQAHSDGDVLIHALCDALLGAAGLGDIGGWFPDADPAFKKAFSLETFLPKIAKKLQSLSISIVNVDATVVLDQPHLKPYVKQMEQNIAGVLGIKKEQVNIKAKRTEQVLFAPDKPAGLAWVNVLLKTT